MGVISPTSRDRSFERQPRCCVGVIRMVEYSKLARSMIHCRISHCSGGVPIKCRCITGLY